MMQLKRVLKWRSNRCTPLATAVLWLSAMGVLSVPMSDPALGQCILTEQVKIAGPFEYRNLGKSVSVSGNVAIAGTNGQLNSPGSAYVYRLDAGQWMMEAHLLASDGGIDDSYGDSVSISGDVAVVGAHLYDGACENSGAVYVYRFDGTDWVEEVLLTAPDAECVIGFGRYVTNSGDLILAGTTIDRVYVFRFDGMDWIEEAVLTASDSLHPDPKACFFSDGFGTSISISGDVVLVGSYLNDDATCGPGSVTCCTPCGLFPECCCCNSGAAYVYRFDGTDWVEEQKLPPSGTECGDFFGESVSINGDVAIVGAKCDGDCSGAAYIYRFDGTEWVEEAKLVSFEPITSDWFGESVAISGNFAVVGNFKDDDACFPYSRAGGCSRSGAAYLYRFDGNDWVEQAKLVASDAFPTDELGKSVSISDNLVMVGAPRAGPVRGHVYIYELPPTDCNANEIPDECEVNDWVRERSGHIGPIGHFFPQSFTIPSPSEARVDVLLQFDYRGDFDSPQEVIDVDLNGVPLGTLTESPNACGYVEQELIVPMETFNDAIAGSKDAVFTMTTSAQVDPTPTQCPNAPSLINIGVTYRFVHPLDQDSNGVPDVCAFDCNGNGIPDPVEIDEQPELDCNDNGILDECEVSGLIDASSGELSPIGSGSPQSYTLFGVREASDDVVLWFTAHGDLNTFGESIVVDIDGTEMGTIFSSGASDCPDQPDEAELIIPMEMFNSAITLGSNAVITMTASSEVDAGLCNDPSFITIQITYTGQGYNDSNNDGVPDDCQLCPADLDGDGTVSTSDLLALFAAWGPNKGNPADLDGDGTVGTNDLLILFANWGLCP